MRNSPVVMILCAVMGALCMWFFMRPPDVVKVEPVVRMDQTHSEEWERGFRWACNAIVMQDWELQELGKEKTWPERFRALRQLYGIPDSEDDDFAATELEMLDKPVLPAGKFKVKEKLNGRDG